MVINTIEKNLFNINKKKDILEFVINIQSNSLIQSLYIELKLNCDTQKKMIL